MNKLVKIFAVFLIGLSFAAISDVSQAYYCRWIGAHWAYGQWYPAQRVCYGGGGYYPYYHHYYRGYGYGHCGWRYGHRVCWY